MATFAPEDYSRFLIREFLKKNKFDKAYDAFMLEDTRPRVAMTKNELTKLLNLANLNDHNRKCKQFDTLLDIISNYFVQTKAQSVPVNLPTEKPIQVEPLLAPSKTMNPMAKTSTAGFHPKTQEPVKEQTHDEGAYEWDESPSKKQVPMGGTSQQFYKPAPAKKTFLMAADDGELEDWDDGIELKKAPAKAQAKPKK